MTNVGEALRVCSRAASGGCTNARTPVKSKCAARGGCSAKSRLWPHSLSSRSERTAAQSLAGTAVPVRSNRGEVLELVSGLRVLITVHPSSLLRLRDEKAEREAYDAFVQDLRSIAQIIAREGGFGAATWNGLDGMIAARASHSLPPFPPIHPAQMGLSGLAEHLSKLGNEYCDAPQDSAPIDEWPGDDLFGSPKPSPDGFRYSANLLTPRAGGELARELAALPFKPFDFHGYQANRQVVGFGFRYDYGSRQVVEAPPLPSFLEPLRQKIAEAFDRPAEAFEQVLINEYRPGAGIGWHGTRPSSTRWSGCRCSPPAHSASGGK